MDRDTEGLVGSAPSEPTNQPTRPTPTPIMYCPVTGLYYIGSERQCAKEYAVGEIIQTADPIGNGTFKLNEDTNPVKLRREVEHLRRENAKLAEQADRYRMIGEVYQTLAESAMGERDRARETAAALEEELHSAVLNLEHIRTTLSINDSFMAGVSDLLPSAITNLVWNVLNADCVVCTPEDRRSVVPHSHPLFQTGPVSE